MSAIKERMVAMGKVKFAWGSPLNCTMQRYMHWQCPLSPSYAQRKSREEQPFTFKMVTLAPQKFKDHSVWQCPLSPSYAQRKSREKQLFTFKMATVAPQKFEEHSNLLPMQISRRDSLPAY